MLHFIITDYWIWNNQTLHYTKWQFIYNNNTKLRAYFSSQLLLQQYNIFCNKIHEIIRCKLN